MNGIGCDANLQVSGFDDEYVVEERMLNQEVLLLETMLCASRVGGVQAGFFECHRP